MANKGNSGYMKRLNAPAYFGIERKGNTYVTKPNPGRHSEEKCVPLVLILKRLAAVKTTDEAKRALGAGAVTVNGKVIRELKYPVGIEDIIETGGESHRITINRQGKIDLAKAERKEMLCKVVGKYKSSKNKIMLRLHDGSTVASKGDIMVNDSVLLASGKIDKRLKLDIGSHCTVIDGVHVGMSGKIVSLSDGTMHRARSVVIEHGKEKLETLVRNIMVTG